MSLRSDVHGRLRTNTQTNDAMPWALLHSISAAAGLCHRYMVQSDYSTSPGN